MCSYHTLCNIHITSLLIVLIRLTTCMFGLLLHRVTRGMVAGLGTRRATRAARGGGDFLYGSSHELSDDAAAAAADDYHGRHGGHYSDYAGELMSLSSSDEAHTGVCRACASLF